VLVELSLICFNKLIRILRYLIDKTYKNVVLVAFLVEANESEQIKETFLLNLLDILQNRGSLT